MIYGKLVKVQDNMFNGFHPNGIDVNFSKVGYILGEPKVGLRFNIGSLSTSTVENIEVVNEYFIKITTSNSLYHLFTGDTQKEAVFAEHVHSLLTVKAEGYSETITELVSLSQAVSILTAFGFEARPEHVEYNGWQLDFWMEVRNPIENIGLEYRGTLWSMSDGVLSTTSAAS